MRKIPLTLALMQFMTIALQAQTHYGTGAGTLGTNHSYFGYYAGNSAKSAGSDNSFFGTQSGRNTVSPVSNTAIGSYSLYSNTSGHSNTAIGMQALHYNTTGYGNTASGTNALFNNTIGYYNVASGYTALFSNVDGSENTAIGSRALFTNLSGNRNVAMGYYALQNNTTGSDNTGTGNGAVGATTSGNGNSGFGSNALTTRTGSYNSAFGNSALNSDTPTECTGSYNTAFGIQASAAGSSSICILSNTTALGAFSKVTASNQVRIGNSNVTSIGGQVSWSTLSDGRFKKNLKKDVSGLKFINELKPVSYTLDKDAIDKFLGVPDSIRIKNSASRKPEREQIGFVAQEIDAVVKKSGYVFTGVHVPKNESDPYTVRYEEFVVPLVKSIQELYASSKTQEKKLGELTDQLSKSNSTGNIIRLGEGVSFQANTHSVSSPIQIQISLPEATTQARLIICSLNGKLLKDIQVNERGTTTMEISSNQFSQGMYLYTLIADGKVVDKKHLILR